MARRHSLPRATSATGSSLGWPILAVCGVYALFALGLVPHMVFLVDFIARGLAGA